MARPELNIARRHAAWAPWALALLLSAAGAAQAAEPSVCTVVYGHGRNFDPEQPAANAHWDELNRGLVDTLAQALAESGRRTVSFSRPVEARDVAANINQMLREAATQGCARVIDATVFGDPATQQLVVRLRLHPIARPAGPPRVDAAASIGNPEVTVQRELQINPRTLSRIMSGELARQLAPEILEHLNP